MITKLILAVLFDAILMLIFLGFIIAILKQEKEIKRLNLTISQKDKTIKELTTKLNEVKSLTREDVDEIVEKNKTLEFQVNDLRQLREMDREARIRLHEENNQLYDLLHNTNLNNIVDKLENIVKFHKGGSNDKTD